jgi:magnesium chelatase subunit D
MELYQFPFSAIVDQTALKTALILNAVDPAIGGVLVRGHKGTGKSTAARALALLLPEGVPFVELPLNATEDRLVGSLNIEKALRSGERCFEPGLLAAANGGILYVDEVNLLEDHLVDAILDAAASGVNIVEREGISYGHAARFILVGTMNPEEGELRPQFLDRFGLCAAVTTVSDPEGREKILQRRLEFEDHPESFVSEWAAADEVLSGQIAKAKARLAQISMPHELTSVMVRLTRSLNVQGHRADIVMFKAARAHAALLEKDSPDLQDLLPAARLAIPHRMKSTPLDSVERLREQIDRAFKEASGDTELTESTPDAFAQDGPEDWMESIQVPGSMAAGSILFQFLEKKQKETVYQPDAEIGATDLRAEDLASEEGGDQRRSKKKITARTGRYLRAQAIEPGEQGFSIALDATLRQAALRRTQNASRSSADFAVSRGDLRKKRFVRPAETLIIFVVDASESMGSGAKARMKAAKGAAVAMLNRAYQDRSKVALVVFGGEEAKVLLAPTSSIDVALAVLETLPTGGATPFADGLMKAWQLVRSQRLKDPGVKPILVIISDGEANVPVSPGVSALEELSALADEIGSAGITALFVDAGAHTSTAMRRIAEKMKASYITMRELTPSSLVSAVRTTVRNQR